MPLSVGNLLLGTASQPMMSAIASSYASGKQDTLTFGYDTSNKITSIDGSAIVGEGAGDTSQCFPASASGMLQPSGNYLSATESSNYYPSSNPSGFLTGVDLTNYATTAYVDSSVSSKLDASASSHFQPSGNYQPSGDYAYNSSVSGKLDASASSDFYPASNPSGFLTSAYSPEFGYDENDNISSIDGSSLAGGGGGGGDFVENSALVVNIGYKNLVQTGYGEFSGVLIQGQQNIVESNDNFVQGRFNSAYGQSIAQGYDNSASSHSLVQGSLNIAIHNCLAQGADNYASSHSLAQGYSSYAINHSFAQGSGNSAISCSFAQGRDNSAISCSFAQGLYNSASATAAVFGQYNSDGQGSGVSGIAFAIGDGTSSASRHNLFEVRKDGTITTYSGTSDNTGIELLSAISMRASLTASSVVMSAEKMAIGYLVSAGSCALVHGNRVSASDWSFSQGAYNYANLYSMSQGLYASSVWDSFAQGSSVEARSASVALGEKCSAKGTSFAQGYGVSAANTATVFGKWNNDGQGSGASGIAFAIGDGKGSAARHNLFEVRKDGNITVYSGTADTVGLSVIDTIRALSAWATAQGWTGM